MHRPPSHSVSFTIWLALIAVSFNAESDSPSLGLDAAQCLKVNNLSGQNRNQTALSAKRAEVSPGETMFLSGDVRIIRGETQISADQALLNIPDNTLDLTDQINIQNNGLCVQGSAASGDFFEGLGLVQSARFRLNESNLRGQADEIRFQPSRRLDLSNGLVTRCPEGSETWQISSASLTANPEAGNVTAKNMLLRVKNVPVLYLPYIKVATDSARQSGFLPIGLSRNSEDGVESSINYYLNLRPNVDATVSTRHLTRRGTLLGGELRGLGPFYTGQINAEYLPKDNFDIWSERSDTPDQARLDRHLVSIFHEYSRDIFSSQIKLIDASDVDFLRDFDSDLAPHAGNLGSVQAANPQYERVLSALNQSIAFKLKGKHLAAQLSYQGFQSLTPLFLDQAEKHPSIVVDYHRRWGSLSASAKVSTTEFRRTTPMPHQFEGKRQTYETHLSWLSEGVWGDLKSTVGFQHKHYAPSSKPSDSTELNYPYVRVIGSTTLFKRGHGIKTTKTLEPRISFVMGRNESQRLQPILDSAPLALNYDAIFDAVGASGNDLGPRNKAVSMGFIHRWVDSRTGRESLSARLGLKHQWGQKKEGRLPSDLKTPILIDLSFSPAPFFKTKISLAYDRAENELNSGFLSLSYQRDPKHFLSLQHRYQMLYPQPLDTSPPEDFSVTQVAFSAPLGRRFHILGLWGKNNTASKNIESIAGLSYNACCWSIEAAYRRYFDPQLIWDEQRFQIKRASRSGLFLTLELKGLMRLGSDVGRLFERSVPVFQPNPR